MAWECCVALHCSQNQSQSQSPLALSAALGCAWTYCVVSFSGETPGHPEPSFSAALGVVAALCNLLCVVVLCRIVLVVGKDPNPPYNLL